MRRNTWMVKLAAGLGSLLLIGGLCACSTQEEETSSLVSQVEDLSLFPEGASIGGKNIAGKTVDEALEIARAAIDEALKCKETGEEKTILFGLTGTGYFDMTAYQKFNDGLMTDYIPTDEELEASFQQLPQI